MGYTYWIVESKFAALEIACGPFPDFAYATSHLNGEAWGECLGGTHEGKRRYGNARVLAISQEWMSEIKEVA